MRSPLSYPGNQCDIGICVYYRTGLADERITYWCNLNLTRSENSGYYDPEGQSSEGRIFTAVALFGN